MRLSMRARWSSRVSRSWKISYASVSRRSDNSSVRQASRTRRVAPSRSPSPSSTRASAKLPLALVGRSHKAVHRGRIAVLLPQPRLGAPAQQRRARPVRIGGDERRVAAEIRCRLRMAQDEPVDELLAGRVGNLVPGGGRVIGLGLAREIDGILDQRQIAASAGLWPPSPAHPSSVLTCRHAVRAGAVQALRCDGGEPPALRAVFWRGDPARPRPSRTRRARQRSGNRTANACTGSFHGPPANRQSQTKRSHNAPAPAPRGSTRPVKQLSRYGNTVPKTRRVMEPEWNPEGMEPARNTAPGRNDRAR